ncbi:hypothetical protein [Streptomyces agglomeratus]|uniref:hypothetical protein n=1 Tax=Streptomyces agglomeratus TaxID=285458 RepID=UPI00114CB049|nr:hypothetical protein [Streptomyces agglomeratus]
MERIYMGERAFSPATGVTRWVVVDSRTYRLHDEAVAYLASLRVRGCSPNTERVYAGRIALYLNYCLMRRLDWKTPGFLGLAGLQQWLIEAPLPSRSGEARPGQVRFRSRATANAVMTVVAEFLRFGATHGWVPAATTALLSEPNAAALHSTRLRGQASSASGVRCRRPRSGSGSLSRAMRTSATSRSVA